MTEAEREAVLTGGCQCGAVRYALYTRPEGTHLCHCRMCQKAVGGPFAALAPVRLKDFAWTRGKPGVFQSSSIALREFCPSCGTPLTFRYAESEGAQKEVKAHAAQEVDHQLSIVERHMEGREWMLGDQRGILDAYLFVFCLWAGFLPKPLKEYPNLSAFAERMKADPGVQAAMKAQGLPV